MNRLTATLIGFALVLQGLTLFATVRITAYGQCLSGNESRATISRTLTGIAARTPHPKEALAFVRPQVLELQPRECSLL